MRLEDIPVSRIRVDYVRDVGSFDDVDALLASVLDIGLVEPVVVQSDPKHNDYYVLIAGYRRLRAYIAASIYRMLKSRKKSETFEAFVLRCRGTLTIPAVVQTGKANGWADKARRAENLIRKGFTEGEKRRLASGRLQEPYHSSTIEFREQRLMPPDEPDIEKMISPNGHFGGTRTAQAFYERDNRFMNRSDTNPKIWKVGTDAFTSIQDEIRRHHKNEDGGVERGRHP